MESSGSSAKAVEAPGHRWAQILGTAIAVITLTLPTLIIAYYSTADARAPERPIPTSPLSTTP
jgi:hypothetical protein